ncbi:hypothetical protein CROQUDRAFT_658649 [Cronartium quercuum f. sp. fusiforme G11]|uniref:CRAL-TRIO domain-containing protein n=1 Tax=Cronartium quercuum f. sp. fusiforme G11 TaxID=708437 RepID=A0A9P6TBB4_9BASI|nr:hypothetical protein CROQUDRAFT_658649 [Cronartium quercuum f. sp. fusiforme G11]
MKHFIFQVFAFVVAVLLAVDCALPPAVQFGPDDFEGKDGNLHRYNIITEEEYKLVREFWKKVLPEVENTVGAQVIAPNIRDTLKSGGSEITFKTAFWLYTRLEDPDFVLVRFLRARKWEVPDAFKMLKECIKWRIEKKVDSLVFKGEKGLPEYSRALLESGLMQIHSLDKTGGPVIYFMLQHYKNPSKDNKAINELEAALIYNMECMRLFISHLRSRATIITDAKESTISRKYISLGEHFMRTMSNYYPGSMKALRVVEASYIVPLLWKIASRLLPTETIKKINFIDKNGLENLKNHVEEEHLLKRFGGSSTRGWNYEAPQQTKVEIDSDSLSKLIEVHNNRIQGYIAATEEWMADPTKKEERDKLLTELKKKGLELDSHFRSETIYHRKGIIKDDGQVNFLHEDKEGRQVEGSRGQVQEVLIKAGEVEGSIDKEHIMLQL